MVFACTGVSPVDKCISLAYETAFPEIRAGILGQNIYSIYLVVYGNIIIIHNC